MRKFCADTGCMEPTERAINQTFSHQVNYARRRLKSTNNSQFGATGAISKKSKISRSDEQQDVKNSSVTMSQKELSDSERYIQM
jgi:hypothetical protein